MTLHKFYEHALGKKGMAKKRWREGLLKLTLSLQTLKPRTREAGDL
jgi:hypothetical protein